MLLDQGVTWREIRQTLPHVDYRDGFESVKYGVDPGNCRVVFFFHFLSNFSGIIEIHLFYLNINNYGQKIDLRRFRHRWFFAVFPFYKGFVGNHRKLQNPKYQKRK